MTWNPDQYLLFADHRLRPALDLLGRVPGDEPRRVVDLGCGAGNVTRYLRQGWPQADITGVDSSPEMLAKAAKAEPSVTWVEADLARWAAPVPVDLIYSNAALHWLPGHARLFPHLMDQLAPGGVLAVQMPNNWAAPSHTSAYEAAEAGPWAAEVSPRLIRQPLLPREDYVDLLAPLSQALDIWETEYLQILSGEDPVAEWTKGAFLSSLPGLPEETREAFIADYKRRLRTAYPRRPDGTTVFPFRRLFIVARKR